MLLYILPVLRSYQTKPKFTILVLNIKLKAVLEAVIPIQLSTVYYQISFFFSKGICLFKLQSEG